MLKGVKKESYPFDWIFSTPDIIIDCINTNFAHFLNKENTDRRGLTLCATALLYIPASKQLLRPLSAVAQGLQRSSHGTIGGRFRPSRYRLLWLAVLDRPGY